MIPLSGSVWPLLSGLLARITQSRIRTQASDCSLEVVSPVYAVGVQCVTLSLSLSGSPPPIQPRAKQAPL